MLGKTNVQVRGTQYNVGPIQVTQDGCTYWPADYNLDYFDRVVVPLDINNNLAKLVGRTLPRFSDAEVGYPTVIPEKVCYKQALLSSIVLPATVTKVEQHAFSHCNALQTVRIDCPNLSMLDIYSFSATGMTQLYLNAPQLNRTQYAFYKNKSLVNLEIAGVYTLEPYTFYECDHLGDVVIPSMCTALGSHCFAISSVCTDYNDLYITLTRQALFDGNNTMTQDVTGVSTNVVYARAQGRYRFLVPLQSLYAYRYRFAEVDANYITYSMAYVDCAAGDTLPSTVTQTYRGSTQTLSLVWYGDRACTTAVTTTPTAGRYYGVATDV